MKKLLCCLLCLLMAGTACAGEFGQSYELFESYYAENILFINANTGRHLLPHTATRDYDNNGRRIYRYTGGALSAEVHLDDLAEMIAMCQITLTAPSHMPYGSPAHNDFNTAGYHSYALLMAMSTAPTALERYALVTEVNAALALGEPYQTNVGDYKLNCTSENGVATLRFENALLMDDGLPDETDETEVPDEEEGDYIG